MTRSADDRCPGSDGPPARVWRGKATCPRCGRRFEPKADGLVRRHELRPAELRPRKVTQK
ncbi:hypothetical protein PBI_INDLOVU_85 [Mycobacterium phage Indlovu]|nr:hypothetical protein PBI_INDLOVU_85 [Mycobacterium phage Indlovu]